MSFWGYQLRSPVSDHDSLNQDNKPNPLEFTCTGLISPNLKKKMLWCLACLVTATCTMEREIPPAGNSSYPKM